MILVDGYNVIFKWESLNKFRSNMGLARSKLINVLVNYQGYIEEDVIVVFDSSLENKVSCDQMFNSNFKVIYAPMNKSADLVIEQMVYSNINKDKITVVTGDTMERMTVVQMGAMVISPERFEKVVREECGGK